MPRLKLYTDKKTKEPVKKGIKSLKEMRTLDCVNVRAYDNEKEKGIEVGD